MSNKVLHRDLRNENILITNDGVVKIIDFGFGKKIEPGTNQNASVFLNWPVSDFPDEINNFQYDHRTEIYFVGKLFNKILDEDGIDDFRYQHIIDKMIVSNPQKRFGSFYEVLQYLSEDIFEGLDFTDTEKKTYSSFANQLISHINFMTNEFKPVTEPKQVISLLENIIKNCLLEDTLQANNELISCFITNSYNYKTKKDIDVGIIRSFYRFFKSLSQIRQKIVLSNIITRLKLISIQYEDDDIPF